MPKNIVILLDGTSNEISSNRTNILRLYGTLAKSPEQLIYYDPGVGTFGAENAWSAAYRKALEVWGLATGWGLDQNVKEAYRFLVQTYDNGKDTAGGERDRIHIIGFSRGAYAARILAGFIHAFGLMEPRNLNLLDYAYRAYKRIDPGRGESSFAELRLHERILRPDRPPIRLLGLFDTVGSVIESGRFGPRLRTHAFTETNPSVESVRHAVAIDERRTMFRPQLWPEGGDYQGNPFNKTAIRPQDVREVWFRGVHGDVGGGYPEEKSGLAKLALRWMIEETAPLGLDYTTRTVNQLVLGGNKDDNYVEPDPKCRPQNSMTWAWSILELLPRRRPADSRRPAFLGLSVPFFERRTIPVGARIHASATHNIEATGDHPVNLPAEHHIEGVS